MRCRCWRSGYGARAIERLPAPTWRGWGGGGASELVLAGELDVLVGVVDGFGEHHCCPEPAQVSKVSVPSTVRIRLDTGTGIGRDGTGHRSRTQSGRYRVVGNGPVAAIATHRGPSWNHADHRAVGRALLDAVRDSGNPWVFPGAGTPWPHVRFVAFSGSPQATHAVDVSDSFNAGVRSLASHAIYLANLGGEMASPDKFLRGAAEAGGIRLGVPLAATFELIT